MSTPTTFNLSSFLLSHLAWIVLLVASVIGIRSYLTEHDARIIAEANIKASQAQVTLLQQNISDRDKAAAIQVAPIIKIIHDVKTVPQAVAALPQVVNTPLPEPVVVQANNSVLIPEPDVLPLFNQVADDKVCRVLLTNANQDITDDKAIIAEKDGQITTLKKKPSFWKRVTSTVEKVGIGIGIGVAVGMKL